MSNKRVCGGCHFKINTRHLTKNPKDGKEYCGSCLRKTRTIINPGFLSIDKIPKEVIEGQKYYPKPIGPIIPGGKDKKERSPYLGIYLTRLEKQIIYKKYFKLGKNPDFIEKRLSNIREQFEKMIGKWKEQKKTDEEIRSHFKEEFAKLVEGIK